MPKRGLDYQRQRGGGDLAAGKRSRPARRQKHLYLVLDDWKKGFSVHKIDTDSFDSDCDDGDQDPRVAVAGLLLEPPALQLESPGDMDTLFTATGSKIFVVTDARYGQTPALIYDNETTGLVIGPAVPARLHCGLGIVVAARKLLYAFSPPACNIQRSFEIVHRQVIHRELLTEVGSYPLTIRCLNLL